jgi:hypothetical protein
MITTQFNSEQGHLDSKFHGDVTIQEIIDYIYATKENADYPRHLKILTDGTEARMVFSAEAVPSIVKANNESLENYYSIIDAIVLDSERETALSEFYEQLSKAPKYRFRVFSTREAAIAWLGSFVDTQESE